jgi:hypothetical protein
MKEGDTLTANNRNKDWDVVATQAMIHNEEEEEAKMRSKAMLIIARKGGSERVWKRVMKRFIKCVENKI